MSQDLKNLTVLELKDLARQRRIGGFSRLRKAELILLLQQSPQQQPQQSLQQSPQQSPQQRNQQPTRQQLQQQLQQCNQQLQQQLQQRSQQCTRQPTQQPTQPIFNNLALLPRDIQIELITNLEPTDLLNLCRTNKQLNLLCQDERLWQRLVQSRYGNEVKMIDNSWRKTYIYKYKYEFVEPYINLFGNVRSFLNVMLPPLLYNMSIVPTEADKYRLRLPVELVEEYYATNDDPDMIDTINEEYKRLRSINPVDPPNPDLLYKLNYDSLLSSINNPRYSFAQDIIERTQDEPSFNQGNIQKLTLLLDKLKNPNYVRRFLNSPIPGLHYTTITNPMGVNYDIRSLLNSDDPYDPEYIPGLNILETGESFDYKINKYYISLLDLLKGIMSVKSSKVDFHYEAVYGIEDFDEEDQILTLEIDHGS